MLAGSEGHGRMGEPASSVGAAVPAAWNARYRKLTPGWLKYPTPVPHEAPPNPWTCKASNFIAK